MRITNNIILHNTTGNINGNKVNVNNLHNQMTSQKKIQRPSENPVIAVRSLRLRTTLSEIDQYYENNIPDAESWMKVTETALANMKTILTDIRTQCTYGASDQITADDRKTILTQLEKLRDQVYAEGNADYAGRTVFTGYRTNQKLTFMTDDNTTSYNITQGLSYKNLEEHRYYSDASDHSSRGDRQHHLESEAGDIRPYPFKLRRDRQHHGQGRQCAVDKRCDRNAQLFLHRCSRRDTDGRRTEGNRIRYI